MTCDQTQALLDVFADEELGWGTAWRVRRHLAGCALCAKELAEVQHLGRRVHEWRDVAAPTGLQSRIAGALPRPTFPVSPRRFPVRRVAVGLAGLGAAAAVVFWLVPGQPGRPTIAFADVEKAMQQVQTVSYDMNSRCYDAEGHVIPGVMSFSFRNWLRRTPPASAQYDAIMREWSLSDARGYVGYSQRLNNYLEKPPEEDIAQTVNTYMRRLTEPPTDADQDGLRSGNFRVQPWQRQEKTVDGQSCLIFTQGLDRTIRMEDGGKAHEFTRITIWVDALTLHIIRIELVGDPTPSVAPNKEKAVVERTVFDNFHYDETPSPGVFDWSPPTGANVRGHW